MSDKQTLTSSIIEISSKNDITKEITMLVHKLDNTNHNGLDFKEEYATTDVINTLINKPVVTKYYVSEDDLGGHEPVFNAQGKIIKLNTIAIGTITDAWIDNYTLEDESVVKAVFSKATLWKYKYPEIINVIERLFNEDNCDTSVEVEIFKYGENPTKEYRYPVEYEYLGNCVLGSNISPADDDAGVLSLSQKEIAEAVKKDLSNLEEKGDITLPDKELFNKGMKIVFKGTVENSELSQDEVRHQIYNLINPVNPSTEEREYNYWIRAIYQSYAIVEDWNNEAVLYKFNYSITNNVVSIDPVNQWVQVEITYQPVGRTELSELVSIKEKEINELNEKINQSKEELSQMEEQIKELQSKIDELNSLVVSSKEEKVQLEAEIAGLKEQHDAKVTELNSTIEELKVYKEKFVTAQKEEKIKELNSKYSKLITKEVFESERVQSAINELNEVELNSIVVEEIAKEKQVETEINSKNDDVTVLASKEEGFSKGGHDYWASPKSE